MPDGIYELIAQGARYWFLFLMALIVWRSWRWYRKDKRKAKKRRKLLPDAGFIGEMVVLEGAGALERGRALPVPREGTLGTMRTNDLCVPASGVARRHLWFRFDDDKGLMVEPFAKQNAVSVDGAAFESRRDPLYMAHGSCLYVGDAVLRLRLFAGFECTGYAVRRNMDVQEEPQQPDQAQIAAQQAAVQEQLWLQQQWLMQQQAYQLGYQQAMAQQQTFAPQAEAEPVEEGMTDVDTYEAARAQGLVDDRAFMRPAGVKKPELPVYEPEEPDEPETTPPVQTEFTTCQPFYAPVEDEPAEEDDWVLEPIKSDYVGHDEAEEAKRRVWDRYLGGGQR